MFNIKYTLKVRQNYITKIISKFHSSKVLYSRKIFSGIQPTGSLHLGNFLGAIRQWVDYQNSNKDVIYCIADLHSITLPHEPAILKQNILNLTASLIACGIDPNKTTLFLQSSIPQHSELSWILGCLTTISRLSHLPQYKEKKESKINVPLGIFIYPILQAADILTYKATHVPVGEDQLQHIQLAQHLGKLFNTKFGETFPQCHGIVLQNPGARIKSLRDPKKKMSKSDPDPKSCIYITDTPDVILSKIKKSLTDFTSEVTYDPEKRPGVSNLLAIHSLVTNQDIEIILDNVKDIDTGQYKLQVAEAVIEYLKPIRSRIFDLLKNFDYLTAVLNEGKFKASIIAENTLDEVKTKVGLYSRTDVNLCSQIKKNML